MCGAVRFTIDGPLRPVINCHCYRCRRWTGHHMAATNCAIVHLWCEDDSAVGWHAPPEHPEVRYGFCPTCGSSLFWRSDDRPDTISVCAGALDPPTGLSTEHALWVDEASDYHVLDESLPSHSRDSGDGGVNFESD